MTIRSTLDPPTVVTDVRDLSDGEILVVHKDSSEAVTPTVRPATHVPGTSPAGDPRTGLRALVRRVLAPDLGDRLAASDGYERAELGRHLLAVGLYR